MLDFFIKSLNTFKTSYPKKNYPSFNYPLEKYKEEMIKIKEYYRNKERHVTNTNLLSKLVHMSCPDTTLDDIDFLSIVEASSQYYARQVGVTSNIEHGDIHTNNMYSKNSYEVFTYVKKDVDIFNIGNNWRELQTLRCVYNQITDLDFCMLDGTKLLEKPNLSVYEIDLVNMLFQYKYWSAERIAIDRGTSPTAFIYMVVLPNLLDSMFDIGIFNRFLTLHKDGKCDAFKPEHPFPVINYSDKVDDTLKLVLRDVGNSSIPIEQLLYNVPTIFGKNMIEVLHINNSFYTNQSEWINWISRLSYIDTLLSIMGETGINRNTSTVYDLRLKIKYLENRCTNLVLPSFFTYNFFNSIDNIKILIGSR